MNPKFIFAYIKKCQNKLIDLSKQEKVSIWSLWLDSLWSYFRYGCTIRQYVNGNFFRYSSFERSKVLTCRKYYKILENTNDISFTRFLEDKSLFNNYFSEFVHRKWVSSREMNENDFSIVCKQNKGIIVKPIEGMEGEGIYRISAEQLSSDSQVKQQFLMLRQSNTIIEELIEQHHNMCFNSDSINTIRVITIMDKKTHEVVILKTVLRAGVGNAVVDNYHQGGCCYEVDVKSGRVCSYGISAKHGKCMFHPGTHICMLGFEIPNWNKVVDGCTKAHKLLPQCRYISWDVAITENGIEIIEGNHNGDYDMIEFVGSGRYWPILKNYL